jgi:hypothetical protein
VDAGVDGIQLDEAELPMGAFQYGACFCKDCMAMFREYLLELPSERRSPLLDGVDLATFHYGEWLLAQGHDFQDDQDRAPLFGDYYRAQCRAIKRYFGELAEYARSYARSVGREVLVSGNFFNVDPSYLALADDVDLIITEMRNTTYRQPEWYRYVAAFAGPKDVVVVENPYGGVVPELVDLLKRGRGYDLYRLSIFEGAAFGAPMSVPYGAWMGSTIQDSFSPPHELAVEVQTFLAENERLYSKASAHEVAVVYSVASTRELIGQADASDNLTNARDASVRVPYRVATETLSHASVPFDVVIFADGETAPDRVDAASLARYRTLVLPDCFDLTPAQAAALRTCLDHGTVLVVTDRFGQTVPTPEREALLAHPNIRRADADDVTALTPGGPQVTVSAPLGVNVHRLDGGVAVHLVNYDHDHEADAVRRTGEVTLTVRLEGMKSVGCAVHRSADGEARKLELDSEGEVHRMTLPDVGVYAVVELTGGPS